MSRAATYLEVLNDGKKSLVLRSTNSSFRIPQGCIHSEYKIAARDFQTTAPRLENIEVGLRPVAQDTKFAPMNVETNRLKVKTPLPHHITPSEVYPSTTQDMTDAFKLACQQGLSAEEELAAKRTKTDGEDISQRGTA
jgi:hypothetical protein